MAPARTVQTYSLPQNFTCKRIGCLPGLGYLWTRSVLPRRDHASQFTILDVFRATVFRWESICELDSDCGSHLLALNPAKSCLPFRVKFPACNDYCCSTDSCMSSW
jgi:hypothetical protein